MKCKAKLLSKLSGEWTLEQEYFCEDKGKYYVICDNRGVCHSIIKTGKIIKCFEINKED